MPVVKIHSNPSPQKSQLLDPSTTVLPGCSVRRALCTEDGSVWLWSAFSVGNTLLKTNNRFLFQYLYPVITKLMDCHTWLMGSVAYQGPWSICEHFNSNMENCMSKYQRVMSCALAFSAECRVFLLGSYLPETLPYSDKITFTCYLQHIKLG